MMMLKVALVLIGVVLTEASQDLMLKMTTTFAKPLESCRKEMDLPESVAKDFVNFWKEDYQLTDRSTGCAIICLASKLDLFDPDYNLHHGNAQEFAKNHGADDATAKHLVEMFHTCALSIPMIPDYCVRSLDIAKCFKAKIHKLDWAPDMEVVIGEMLAQI